MAPKEQPSTLPLPRLVVRVGVTGHRPHKLPFESQGALKQKVREVLETIKAITQKIFEECRQPGQELYSAEIPELRLISSLAEGADRLVAEEASHRDVGFKLQCPLPFHRSTYERKDFQTGESRNTFRRLLKPDVTTAVLELDGKIKKAEEAYEAAGRVMLSQCDVLVAIWNGKPGTQGGTQQIVGEAVAAEIPVIWIHPETIATMLWEASPQPSEPGRQENIEQLEERLKRIFLPSSDDEGELTHRFLKEKRRQAQSFDVKVQNWPKIWDSFSRLKPEESAQLDDKYLKLFSRADGFAGIYGKRYSRSFVASYLMGASAILFAVLGSQEGARHLNAWLGSYLPSGMNHFPAWAEAMLIFAIIAITVAGRRGHWHERWMDYRVLAESLRQSQFLIPLGRVTANFRVPSHLEPGDPRRKWFNWYFRALVRETGMICAKIDPSYCKDLHGRLALWVEQQIKYHKDKEESFEKIGHSLHFMAQALFVTTAVFCVMHLSHRFAGYEFLLTLGVIVLPAFGGALGAIFHIGEYERIAKRSGALKERLKRLLTQIKGLDNDATSRDLTALAQSVSEVTLDELVDWRFVFLYKNLSLPA